MASPPRVTSNIDNTKFQGELPVMIMTMTMKILYLTIIYRLK